ncbi:hypothetical protein LEMLEM_LOCUS27730, partial [Lemmus lemmus]
EPLAADVISVCISDQRGKRSVSYGSVLGACFFSLECDSHEVTGQGLFLA